MLKLPIAIFGAAALLASTGAAIAQSSSGSQGGEAIRNPDITKTPPGIPVPEGKAGKKAANPTSPGDNIQFESKVPDWPAGEKREQAEAEMKGEVETWQTRVARYSNGVEDGTTAQKNAARRLEKAWRALEQNWQKVRQSQQNEHWEKARGDYAQSVQEIARLWDQVERTGEVGPRTQN